MFEQYEPWYKDDEYGIFFSIKPKVSMQYIDPYADKEERDRIEAKPFLNEQSFDVALVDYINDEIYKFNVPEGYTWDGASIPRLFWRLVGSKTDNRFLIASLIHDVLCENHNYVYNDRYFADKIFERLLYVSGVNAFNRWMMFHSVDNYQKLFGGWRKK